MIIALSSAKQNAEYRISCGNEQPGIESVCRTLISEYKLKTKYEDLSKYQGKSNPEKEKHSIGKTNVVSTQISDNYLKIRISIGAIVFEAEGTPKEVIAQEKNFAKELLPNALASLDGIYAKQKKAEEKNKKGPNLHIRSKEKIPSEPIGAKIAKKHKNIINLKEKMDFKAKMIPLMFLATEDKLQNDFSIKDIQQILFDALKITTEKNK